VEESAVVVTEYFRGDICRCICTSTLRAKIPLERGKYTLGIRSLTEQADGSEKVEVVHEETLEIP
jgi:hypothetical protein